MAARIPPTTIATAPEAARPILEGIQKSIGRVPNLYATMGHSPAALKAYLGAAEALGKGGLAPREAELVSLWVSELNGCAYCVAAHTVLGARAGLSPDEIAQARSGQGGSARDGAILALARRVLRTGGAQAGSELAAARAAGLGDGEIVEVLAHVALRSLANSVAILARTEIDFPKAPRMPEP